MTPFEVNLQNDLEVEQLRFANEWLFRWRNLNIKGKIVDVDGFDGRRITLSGITFGDQQQSIYWQAIGRYLASMMHSVFRRWDEETKDYPIASRKTSLDGTSQLLKSFAGGVIARAIKTDQAVRGRGYPRSDEPYQVSAVRTAANAKIEQLLQAHILLTESHGNNLGWWRGFWEAVNVRPGLFGISIDLKKIFKRPVQ
jgi:hypothetical protein